MTGELFSAIQGQGATLNGHTIGVSQSKAVSESLLVTGFPYNIKDNPNNAFEKFTAFLKEARGVRRLGSAAIDCCYVAAGVFDGFWEVTLNAWDICAGHLLVEEAGGKVSTFSDQSIDYKAYDSVEFLATNGEIHRAMMDVLESN